MEQIGDMKVFTFEEVLDEDLGKIGTPERDAFEAEVRDEIQAYHLGEAIKSVRKKKNLTQAQLGELMGVQRARISKIESGKHLHLTTVARVFRALGIVGTLSFEGLSVTI